MHKTNTSHPLLVGKEVNHFPHVQWLVPILHTVSVTNIFMQKYKKHILILNFHKTTLLFWLIIVTNQTSKTNSKLSSKITKHLVEFTKRLINFTICLVLRRTFSLTK